MAKRYRGSANYASLCINNLEYLKTEKYVHYHEFKTEITKLASYTRSNINHYSSSLLFIQYLSLVSQLSVNYVRCSSLTACCYAKPDFLYTYAISIPMMLFKFPLVAQKLFPFPREFRFPGTLLLSWQFIALLLIAKQSIKIHGTRTTFSKMRKNGHTHT